MNTNIKTTLIDKVTGRKIKFNSMSKASQFLNKNNGYISNLFKKGITETDKYKIVKE